MNPPDPNPHPVRDRPVPQSRRDRLRDAFVAWALGYLTSRGYFASPEQGRDMLENARPRDALRLYRQRKH